jgi:hypothetical protein
MQRRDISVVRELEVAVADLMQKKTALNPMLRTFKTTPGVKVRRSSKVLFWEKMELGRFK